MSDIFTGIYLSIAWNPRHGRVVISCFPTLSSNRRSESVRLFFLLPPLAKRRYDDKLRLRLTGRRTHLGTHAMTMGFWDAKSFQTGIWGGGWWVGLLIIRKKANHLDQI